MLSYRNSEPRRRSCRARRRDLIVPRLDWDRPPWNRWAFQHIREILPTAEVWRGNGHRRRFERAEADLDALPVSDSDGRPTTLAGLLDETYTDGFLVLKDGSDRLRALFQRHDRAHAASVAVHGEVGDRRRYSASWSGAACSIRRSRSPTICRSSQRPAGAAPPCSMCST